ncbi:alpha/beta fold hydrolase [Mycobacterium conspicuum]|uniref:Putative epoxide hydrolase EphC n=1 Tax=Mycobacterium conspicuum TaxID=44010 RepID=A0A1X1TI29_9MYCO|nr:alpha/beta hydrolase [Mycobacterium conspicuum]ORV44170.1 alpha/beta hydrolase [Mycobacterium conspicuum]BBZ41029.1 putative epoxide hydrolase EphC [Mycobacterium conspicuum]
MPQPGPLTFGDIDDISRPLAIAVHGFPDTPHTWRYLGPALAAAGYRVLAPWLPGYDAPATGPISVGTYVRYIGDLRRKYQGDDRCVLVGHDWGANAGYGAVAFDPSGYSRLVTLAVPPVGALGSPMFAYRQLKRSFYIWFMQQVGLAEAALAAPGFWESLWTDWSPGHDWSEDVAQLRRSVTEESIAGIICPYRASFQPQFADPEVSVEAAATLVPPPVRTLYLHGANDGALGAELLEDVTAHLPAAGSRFELLDGVGHFLHLERPDQVADIICGWLQAD